MRKTTIQTILDLILTFVFIALVLIYALGYYPQEYFRGVFVSAFFIIITIMCWIKYLLYGKQNFLFFTLVFIVDLLLTLLYHQRLDILINNDFGCFLLVPGLILCLYYIVSKEIYQIRLGIFLMILGLGLLLIF